DVLAASVRVVLDPALGQHNETTPTRDSYKGRTTIDAVRTALVPHPAPPSSTPVHPSGWRAGPGGVGPLCHARCVTVSVASTGRRSTVRRMADVVDRLAAVPGREGRLVHLEVLPARPGRFAPWPGWADPGVVAAFRARGSQNHGRTRRSRPRR